MNVGELPSSSLVPLATHRVKTFQVLPCDSKYDLEKFAYALPIAGSASSNYLSDIRLGNVDRYGGPGVGANGGSGRVVNYGDIQVKGIGRTPLVSRHAPDWHANGFLTLEEGIREVIYSKVFSAVLPFGAVPILGLIVLDEWVGARYQDPVDSISVRRCLLVRESTIRPAHFMRAQNFETPLDMVSEARRMAAVTDRLPKLLAASLGEGNSERSLLENFIEFLTRVARQLAASIISRLVHGGLSPSNMALDGRWLDFGMSTAIGDYGNIIVSGRRPALWDQALFVARSMAKFGENYNAATGANVLLSRQEVEAIFLAQFHNFADRQLIELAGFEFLEEMPAEQDALIREINAILQTYPVEPVKLLSACPDYCPITFEKMGMQRLNSILQIAAACLDDGQRARALASEIRNDQQLRSFNSAYSRFLRCYVEKGLLVDDRHRLERSFIEALRRNTAIRSLYREALIPKIVAHSDSASMASSLIEHTIGDVLPMIDRRTNHRPIVELDGLGRLSWDEQRGFRLGGTAVEGQVIKQSVLAHLQQQSNGRRRAGINIYSNWNVDGCARDHGATIQKQLDELRTLAQRVSRESRNLLPPEYLKDFEHCLSNKWMKKFYSEDRDLVGVLAWTESDAANGKRCALKYCLFLRGRLKYGIPYIADLFAEFESVSIKTRGGALLDIASRLQRSQRPPKECRCGRKMSSCHMLVAQGPE